MKETKVRGRGRRFMALKGREGEGGEKRRAILEGKKEETEGEKVRQNGMVEDGRVMGV